MKSALLSCLLVLTPLTLAAQDTITAAPTPPSTDSMQAAMKEFESKLSYQRGSIVIGEGLATLTVPESFRYLGPDDAEKLLVDGWGNPPGNTTLGMLFPSDLSPLSEQGWGVVITYDEDGYVKDDEAEKLNYAELLEQMQAATRESNAQRKKAGYESIELIGWAAQPHYDKTTHKLYWAKELKFGDNSEHTLNYNIRALGRKGVLVLNAVASTKQVAEIETKMAEVLQFVDFNEGHRYADFTPGVDKVAAYGIGALIAGKVAAKAGLFKILLGALVAAKKLIIVGLAGAAIFLRKFLKKDAPRDAKA